MPYAIELFLDDAADRQIRRMWAALDEHGILSPGGVLDADYHPHISLTVFDQGDPDEIAHALRPVLAQSIGLPLPLAPLGFFLTTEAPVFLGVIPSARFLALHHVVHAVVETMAEGIWPYYRPDALLPHCTLATGVTEPARVAEIVRGFTIPVAARAASAHLVTVPGGQSIPLT
jgi:hypothetical protein